ncbi:uncharacterized protein ABDE67_002722 [Symphorus nematophorus]
MVQRGGSDFWVVSCISSGGRPDTDISLALNAGEELQRENNTDSDRQIISVHLPAAEYEGHNVTYLSGVQMLNSKLQRNSDDDFQDYESLELLDGESDTIISLLVTGNVPRYNVTCKKDDGPLPEDMELVCSSLTVQGPVGHQHAGLYECFFSYHHHQATLKFNVTVKPHIIQPVRPTIRVDLQTEDGRRVIECSAADAVPAANMSWLLPEEAPLLNVSVQRQQDSPLWLAVCDCRGEGAGTNLAWILPENAKSQTSLQSHYEGQALKARLTYQFPLALHEGQDLTCVYHIEHGITEKKTIHIPRYYISSVRVLNHTTPLQSRYGGKPITHRLTLQENHHQQRVLLRVEGNVPDYNLNCKRSDGSLVQMERDAMVFQSELTKQVEGQYICQASFYHHTATVSIQVEVLTEDKLFATVSMICISSASAILFIFIAVLWVCCKANSSTQYKRKESLAGLTALMQQPGSPEVKKPPVTETDSKEYAHLVSYSIVIDVKSTV